jgi:hypothetical protein
MKGSSELHIVYFRGHKFRLARHCTARETFIVISNLLTLSEWVILYLFDKVKLNDANTSFKTDIYLKRDEKGIGFTYKQTHNEALLLWD